MEADIEFHRRGLATFLFVLAAVFTILGLLFIAVALGEAAKRDQSREGWTSILQWSFGGFVWLLAAPKMLTMARAYRKNFVRFGASVVTFHTLTDHEYQIPYAAIRSLHWDPSPRKRLLTIDTDETRYHFDSRSTPRIDKVMELLQNCIRPIWKSEV